MHENTLLFVGDLNRNSQDYSKSCPGYHFSTHLDLQEFQKHVQQQWIA